MPLLFRFIDEILMQLPEHGLHYTHILLTDGPEIVFQGVSID